MKALMFAAAAALFAAQMSTAFAADEAKKPTAQQEKMKTCNKDAGEKKLKGDERKKFMSECLSNKPAAAPAATPATTSDKAAEKPASQKDKMKTCNKDAGEKKLKGDERKKFMSDCLKA